MPASLRLFHWQDKLSPVLRDTLCDMCASRLVLRTPIQYLVGSWDFYNITLAVRAPVLIPRPETEELVERIVNFYSGVHPHPPPPRVFLDVGCGSGAIALALLKVWPQSKAIMIDISPHSVALSRENANALGLEARCCILQTDMRSLPDHLRGLNLGEFSRSGCETMTGSFKLDMIVSNPPYIPKDEMNGLDFEVRGHEDFGALCGGEDGMDVVREILEAAHRVAGSGAMVWLELDPSHPEQLQDALNGVSERHNLVADVGDILKNGRFRCVHIWRDLSDRWRFAQLSLLAEDGFEPNEGMR